MPGLTLNTGGAVANTSGYPPSSSTSQAPNTSTAANENTSHPSSPQRPTYSPITPPLKPTTFPARPTYTHSSHQDQVAIAPPPPEPINFHTNPDVLALKSAISILQMQRRRAEADMAKLSQVKTAALAEPEAFIQDLLTKRIGVEGERLFVGGVKSDEDQDSDSSSDSDEDMEGADPSAAGQQDPTTSAPPPGEQPAQSSIPTNANPAEPSATIKTEPGATSTEQPPPQPESSTQPQPQPQPQPQSRPESKPQPRPWSTVPKPQNVVRCPPINWSQYAIVGESLDKLHAEQQAAPSQGTPATLAPDGRYEHKGGGSGRQEKLIGVAAPYNPSKDQIQRKSKGVKR
ncbi:hypothetical protein M426DRAFT_316890 [Hypoxylon sp. CI-4A]|nr:hypothetical protein M426DRAFT_316890 [Hypoxylon sp. CI-4A]